MPNRRRLKFAIVSLLLLAGVLFTAYVLFISGAFMRRPSFERFPVQGIDVSHHQGDVDWERVATDRRGAFAYMKASEGGDFKDRKFAENWSRAKAFGIPRGAYHFFTLCRPGLDQARNFVDSLKTDFGELPPAIDLEFLGNCSKRPSREELLREVNAFVEELKRHDQRKPIFYVTSDFSRKYIEGLENSYPAHENWKRSLLWEPSGDWVFWQFAETGRVEGVEGPVDLNVFYGSREEFAQHLAGPKD